MSNAQNFHDFLMKFVPLHPFPIYSLVQLWYRCGIVYPYPIYGDCLLIGRSNLSYACTNRSFALFSATDIAGRVGIYLARARTLVHFNKRVCHQIVFFTNTKKYNNHYMTQPSFAPLR